MYMGCTVPFKMGVDTLSTTQVPGRLWVPGLLHGAPSSSRRTTKVGHGPIVSKGAGTNRVS